MRMKADPETFYITDHYLNYPWILVRLAKVEREDLRELLGDAWQLSAPARRLPERGRSKGNGGMIRVARFAMRRPGHEDFAWAPEFLFGSYPCGPGWPRTGDCERPGSPREDQGTKTLPWAPQSVPGCETRRPGETLPWAPEFLFGSTRALCRRSVAARLYSRRSHQIQSATTRPRELTSR